MEEKYRLSYDEHFLPINIDEGVPYNGRFINGLSLEFIYKRFSKKTGEELFFSDPKDQEIPVPRGAIAPFGFYLNSLYCCEINKLNGYTMKPRNDVMTRLEYDVTCTLDGENAFVWYKDDDTPELISSKVAIGILKDNYDRFDCSNNKPTQSLTYSAIKVD